MYELLILFTLSELARAQEDEKIYFPHLFSLSDNWYEWSFSIIAFLMMLVLGSITSRLCLNKVQVDYNIKKFNHPLSEEVLKQYNWHLIREVDVEHLVESIRNLEKAIMEAVGLPRSSIPRSKAQQLAPLLSDKIRNLICGPIKKIKCNTLKFSYRNRLNTFGCVYIISITLHQLVAILNPKLEQDPNDIFWLPITGDVDFQVAEKYLRSFCNLEKFMSRKVNSSNRETSGSVVAWVKLVKFVSQKASHLRMIKTLHDNDPGFYESVFLIFLMSLYLFCVHIRYVSLIYQDVVLVHIP